MIMFVVVAMFAIINQLIIPLLTINNLASYYLSIYYNANKITKIMLSCDNLNLEIKIQYQKS